jgi:hypothetical protein
MKCKSFRCDGCSSIKPCDEHNITEYAESIFKPNTNGEFRYVIRKGQFCGDCIEPESQFQNMVETFKTLIDKIKESILTQSERIERLERFLNTDVSEEEEVPLD